MNKIIFVLVIAGLLFTFAQEDSKNKDSKNTDLKNTVEKDVEKITADIDIPEGYKLVPFLSEAQIQNFEKAEQVMEKGKDYSAILVTSKGTMQIDLYEKAPKTANNFVFLSLHHYFEGIVFHRVLENFMAQTGDPLGTGRGGPGYQFDDEVSPELRHSEKGIVSMANSGANTNGSQFFITFVATNFLDGYDANGNLKNCADFNQACHSVFGKVVKGLEVLDKIQRIDPNETRATLVAYANDKLSALQKQGVKLAGAGDTIIEDYVIEKLGSLPPIGEFFEVDGNKGIMGKVDDRYLAIGFYPKPDVIEAVYIIEKVVE